MSSKAILDKILGGLNAAQRIAVTSPPTGQLQIIAGPGTGKTKVLTSRVAYLMIHHNIRPESIIVTTFTKKAANEMKERLSHLLKNTDLQLNKLLIGTFHSICSRILFQYGHVINLAKFKVAAERDWDDAMKSVINPMVDDVSNFRALLQKENIDKGEHIDLENKRGNDENPYDLRLLKKAISRLKSRGLYPSDYSRQKNYNKELHIIYTLFQQRLEKDKMLDFDDLLNKANDVLKARNVLKNINHVLIDEFQDTNSVQLELMTRFSQGRTGNDHCVTVVGDPDQSIYRFRDAVVFNFELMRKKFPSCQIVKLDQNYRSTSGVLDLSEELMRQQKDRTTKSLKSVFDHTFPPVYQKFYSGDEEAKYIASEIERLSLLPGLFDFSSFAVLVRSSFLTRSIEKAFVEKKIPYHIVKGTSFWKRKECEMIVDLLRMVANDEDKPALLRTIQSLTEGIGPATLKRIDAAVTTGAENGIPYLTTLRHISEGKVKGLTGDKFRSEILNYLGHIQEARALSNSPLDQHTVLIKTYDYLLTKGPIKTLNDENSEASQNLKEVKSQLLAFEPVDNEILELDDGATPSEIIKETQLQQFLSSLDIYAVDLQNDKGNKGSVCISTIHSAKGLEWPVVFVPGLTEGFLPPNMDKKEKDPAEFINEERRIFYVAITRSQQLLYLSSPMNTGWINSDGEASQFVSKKVLKLSTSEQKALQDLESVQCLYSGLGKVVLDQYKAKCAIEEYQLSIIQNEKLNAHQAMERFKNSFDDMSEVGNSSFRSARSPRGGKSNYHHHRHRSRSRSPTRFSRGLTTETRLPAPGIKSFAPSSGPKIQLAPVTMKINRTLAPLSSNVTSKPETSSEQPKRKKTLGVRRRMVKYPGSS